jgi:ABC-type sugar transport system substrate-binding protein
MVSTIHKRRGLALAGTALAVSLLAAGCSKSDESTSGSNNGTSGAAGGGPAATVASSASAPAGEGCTLSKYGATKIDLKNAIVGFSQSEPETAAFRVAETKSIQDEAAKLGVKKLLHTNANAQLSKQIADIQDMLNQGAQFLIVAPLNSDGLDPALAAAKAKHVPVLTIDRKVNATACSDYVAFIGSNFVEQGKRAADALAKSTGGKGNIAILLGSSGNNVTTDRTNGFVQEIKTAAPDMKVVAQQTGDFARGVRRERRDGSGRDRGHLGRRQEARHRHQGGLDRRHPQRRAGHRGRQVQRRDRVEPPVRPARLQDRAGLPRRHRDSRERHHLRQRVRPEQCQGECGQRLLGSLTRLAGCLASRDRALRIVAVPSLFRPDQALEGSVGGARPSRGHRHQRRHG